METKAVEPSELELDAEAIARREFLKKTGKIALTAPAVALLLSASAKPAWAWERYCPDTDKQWVKPTFFFFRRR